MGRCYCDDAGGNRNRVRECGPGVWFILLIVEMEKRQAPRWDRALQVSRRRCRAGCLLNVDVVGGNVLVGSGLAAEMTVYVGFATADG